MRFQINIEFDDNSNAFVTTLGDGIFRSTDNGDSWTAINNGLTSLSTLGISINSAGHILVGTFDGFFRSADSGDNWTLVYSSVIAIHFDLNSNGDLYTRSYSDLCYSLFQSIDNGETWTEVSKSKFDSDPTFVCTTTDDNIFVGTASGVYIYTLRACEYVDSKKMIVLT